MSMVAGAFESGLDSKKEWKTILSLNHFLIFSKPGFFYGVELSFQQDKASAVTTRELRPRAHAAGLYTAPIELRTSVRGIQHSQNLSGQRPSLPSTLSPKPHALAVVPER